MNSVCAVIVTYNPGADLSNNILALRKQVDDLVIVDNASSGAALDRIADVQRQTPCSVIYNDRNRGIAAALNVGFRYAMDNQYEWIVAFDQDSTVTTGFIEAMLHKGLTEARVGIICPTYQDPVSKLAIKMPKTRSGDLLTTMTSGSMIHRATFERAGLFEEKLFIDSVDTEYSLRLRSMGFRLVETEQAILLHSLGRIGVHRFLGKTLVTTNHSAARRYYITRNRLLILHRYIRDWPWVRFDATGFVREFLVMLLVEDQRPAKLRQMIKGVIDCVCGRWGQQVPL